MLTGSDIEAHHRVAGLDRYSSRGRQFIEAERVVAEQVAALTNTQCVELGDSAPIDRIFVRDQRVRSIAEIKVRTISLDQLREWGSYLITAQKLTDGQRISQLLQVPFYLIVRPLKEEDGCLFWWRVTDAYGVFQVEYSVEKTLTQRSCNGGRALRDNAYLPIEIMHIHGGPTGCI